jgi:Fur family transcriptional regulator, zinc uptake regulator
MAQPSQFMFVGSASIEHGRPPLDAYYRAFDAREVPPSMLRREILSFLWHSGAPWGVYELAARMSRDGVRTHPNSVYRSIRVLAAAGLVIPIFSWNRYLLSPDPEIRSWCLILCSWCGRVSAVAMEDEADRITSLARERGFRPERVALECKGMCPDCRSRGVPGPRKESLAEG